MKKNGPLSSFWNVKTIDESGILHTPGKCGLMFELDGLDGSFLSSEQLSRLHTEWRSVLHLNPGDEIQFIFRKRVEFSAWIEEQLRKSFLAENAYGRRILLDRLNQQLEKMSRDEPLLLAQKIFATYWLAEPLTEQEALERRPLLAAQLRAFGFDCRSLDRAALANEIFQSAHDLDASENQEMEWPSLNLRAGLIEIGDTRFRALEMTKLPESHTELGMIQALTALPLPIDLSVRLRCRDQRPISKRLERKRNVLQAQRSNRNSPSPQIDSQLHQIDQILSDLANHSEEIFDLNLTVGLRFPKSLASIQRRSIANLMRRAARMDFCELEECSLGTFDSFLECIPGFTGKNLRSHTVLASNAIHFLPFFRPAPGDRRPICTFETRQSTIYGIDPVDPRLANYNWLVSGTSGAGKSFFVNSLLAQSMPLDPNIFIIDIGGSYNKLTQFLGGEVLSLEPGRGFEMSPFFLPASDDPKEERLRRQHILQIFLEMVRVDGGLPPPEVRHLLQDELEKLFNLKSLPERPVTAMLSGLAADSSEEAKRLRVLLRPWAYENFNGQFLDNARLLDHSARILTYDLKGLNDFPDLSRVIQLTLCANLWGRVRRSEGRKFSFIVLDEVAFSLLKVQPDFVDELVATLRKYYAGAVIVVQDLEKITSNTAGASILQNAQSKAILQQRGDPRNYCEALALTTVDQMAIESLDRQKGVYSDIFLIRDLERTVIRHSPGSLEYWLSTTAPEDNLKLRESLRNPEGTYQKKVIDFAGRRKEKSQ